MMSDLNSILVGEDEPNEQTEVVAQDVSEVVDTQGEAAPETPAVQVQAPQEPQEDRIPQAALIAERRKRQEIERELQAYRQQAAQQQPQFEQDPNEWASHFQQQMQSQMKASLVDMSETLVRAQFKDFDQVRDAFIESASQNPVYINQMMASPNPALYAYQEGKRLMALREMGDDPQAWRKSIEEKAVAAYLESQKTQATQASVANLPTSLGDVRATGGQKAEQYAGPKPLNDILASKRKK